MSELQVFNSAEFGSVRSLMVNGEPYFVGKDVTDILGVSKRKVLIKVAGSCKDIRKAF